MRIKNIFTKHRVKVTVIVLSIFFLLLSGFIVVGNYIGMQPGETVKIVGCGSVYIQPGYWKMVNGNFIFVIPVTCHHVGMK